MLSDTPLLLIFDLDGTLADTHADLCTAVNLTRAHYGLPPLSGDVIAGNVGNGIHKLVERSLEGHTVDIEEAVALQKKFYREHLADETTLYPGVREGLARLQAAGHTLAVLTNKTGEHTRALLEQLAVLPRFAVIIGGGDLPQLKPDPAPIAEVMRRVGMPAERTWMIGDHHTDLEAARRAGVRSAFVTYGIGNTGTEQPDRTFQTFFDLVKAFIRDSAP